MQERLQKILSRAGVASRRAAEEMIVAGRVRVNGRVMTELGAKADFHNDDVEIDGRKLIPEALQYFLLHKPRGVVSTMSDPEGRPTVAQLLEGLDGRLYPVGRLDFATSGVLLVTNDGDFANGLLHPRGGVPKSYVLKVRGLMTDEDLERWATGVELEDGKTLPAHVRLIRHEDDKTWFEITIREGRNQQIRRMGEATRFPVMRLARTSFAGITSEGVRPGEWRTLTHEELTTLREQYGVPKRVRGAVSHAVQVREDVPRRFPSGARPHARPTSGGDRSPRPDRATRTEGRGDARPARSPHARAERGHSAPRDDRGADTRPTRSPHARSAPRDDRGGDTRPARSPHARSERGREAPPGGRSDRGPDARSARPSHEREAPRGGRSGRTDRGGDTRPARAPFSPRKDGGREAPRSSTRGADDNNRGADTRPARPTHSREVPRTSDAPRSPHDRSRRAAPREAQARPENPRASSAPRSSHDRSRRDAPREAQGRPPGKGRKPTR